MTMTNSPLSKRIKAYCDYKHYSQAYVCETIGKSRTWINTLGNSLTMDTYNGFRDKFPDLNLVWLTTGEGEMIQDVENPTSMTYKITSMKQELEKAEARIKELEATVAEYKTTIAEKDAIIKKLIDKL